ncbi:MAG TPA: hypothetical protein PLN56_08035 [Methanoregulaceae archaeon]|nr:MAG: hypothetical protein IPI71_00435 [Methanolinea sp.]HPD10932.1 hypothetical protein [Methanoregulaceae archaeon]
MADPGSWAGDRNFDTADTGGYRKAAVSGRYFPPGAISIVIDESIACGHRTE